MMNKYQEALEYFLLWINPSSEEFDYDNYLKHRKTLKELVDKETPLTPPLKWEYAKPQTRCKCSAGVETYHNYCWHCGQKLGSDTDE